MRVYNTTSRVIGFTFPKKSNISTILIKPGVYGTEISDDLADKLRKNTLFIALAEKNQVSFEKKKIISLEEARYNGRMLEKTAPANLKTLPVGQTIPTTKGVGSMTSHRVGAGTLDIPVS